MGEVFSTLIYEPLYNLLVFFYNIVPGGDFGITIILITIVLRSLLYPVYKKQIASQKQLQELQPKIKAIQSKHKNDKEKQTKALMELYKEAKTNPLSGCLPLIIQLVFLIAIYQILMNISNNSFAVDGSLLYSFISNPGTVKSTFISLVDLTRPNIIIAALAALAQYFQTKMLLDKQKSTTAIVDEKSSATEPDFAQIMNKQMVFLGPVLTLVIGVKFPAGLSLYWLTSTLYMLVQQVAMQKSGISEMFRLNKGA